MAVCQVTVSLADGVTPLPRGRRSPLVGEGGGGFGDGAPAEVTLWATRGLTFADVLAECCHAWNLDPTEHVLAGVAGDSDDAGHVVDMDTHVVDSARRAGRRNVKVVLRPLASIGGSAGLLSGGTTPRVSPPLLASSLLSPSSPHTPGNSFVSIAAEPQAATRYANSAASPQNGDHDNSSAGIAVGAARTGRDGADAVSLAGDPSIVERELWSVFTYYCLLGHSVTAARLSCHQFCALIQDCSILRRRIHRSAAELVFASGARRGRVMDYGAFLDALGALARHAWPGPARSGKFEECVGRVVDNILACCRRRTLRHGDPGWDATTVLLQLPQVAAVMREVEAPISWLARYYADGDGKSIPFDNFLRAVHDLELESIGLPLTVWASAFLGVADAEAAVHAGETTEDEVGLVRLLRQPRRRPLGHSAGEADSHAAQGARALTLSTEVRARQRTRVSANGIVAVIFRGAFASLPLMYGADEVYDAARNAIESSSSEPVRPGSVIAGALLLLQEVVDDLPTALVKATLQHLARALRRSNVELILEHRRRVCLFPERLLSAASALGTRFQEMWAEDGNPDYLNEWVGAAVPALDVWHNASQVMKQNTRSFGRTVQFASSEDADVGEATATHRRHVSADDDSLRFISSATPSMARSWKAMNNDLRATPGDVGSHRRAQPLRLAAVRKSLTAMPLIQRSSTPDLFALRDRQPRSLAGSSQTTPEYAAGRREMRSLAGTATPRIVGSMRKASTPVFTFARTRAQSARDVFRGPASSPTARTDDDLVLEHNLHGAGLRVVRTMANTLTFAATPGATMSPRGVEALNEWAGWQVNAARRRVERFRYLRDRAISAAAFAVDPIGVAGVVTPDTVPSDEPFVGHSERRRLSSASSAGGSVDGVASESSDTETDSVASRSGSSFASLSYDSDSSGSVEVLLGDGSVVKVLDKKKEAEHDGSPEDGVPATADSARGASVNAGRLDSGRDLPRIKLADPPEDLGIAAAPAKSPPLHAGPPRHVSRRARDAPSGHDDDRRSSRGRADAYADSVELGVRSSPETGPASDREGGDSAFGASSDEDAAEGPSGGGAVAAPARVARLRGHVAHQPSLDSQATQGDSDSSVSADEASSRVAVVTAADRTRITGVSVPERSEGAATGGDRGLTMPRVERQRSRSLTRPFPPPQLHPAGDTLEHAGAEDPGRRRRSAAVRRMRHGESPVLEGRTPMTHEPDTLPPLLPAVLDPALPDSARSAVNESVTVDGDEAGDDDTEDFGLSPLDRPAYELVVALRDVRHAKDQATVAFQSTMRSIFEATVKSGGSAAARNRSNTRVEQLRVLAAHTLYDLGNLCQVEAEVLLEFMGWLAEASGIGGNGGLDGEDRNKSSVAPTPESCVEDVFERLSLSRAGALFDEVIGSSSQHARLVEQVRNRKDESEDGPSEASEAYPMPGTRAAEVLDENALTPDVVTIHSFEEACTAASRALDSAVRFYSRAAATRRKWPAVYNNWAKALTMRATLNYPKLIWVTRPEATGASSSPDRAGYVSRVLAQPLCAVVKCMLHDRETSLGCLRDALKHAEMACTLQPHEETYADAVATIVAQVLVHRDVITRERVDLGTTAVRPLRTAALWWTAQRSWNMRPSDDATNHSPALFSPDAGVARGLDTGRSMASLRSAASGDSTGSPGGSTTAAASVGLYLREPAGALNAALGRLEPGTVLVEVVDLAPGMKVFVEDLFRAFDTDRDGGLCAKELDAFNSACGDGAVSESALRWMRSHFDVTWDGYLSQDGVAQYFIWLALANPTALRTVMARVGGPGVAATLAQLWALGSGFHFTAQSHAVADALASQGRSRRSSNPSLPVEIGAALNFRGLGHGRKTSAGSDGLWNAGLAQDPVEPRGRTNSVASNIAASIAVSDAKIEEAAVTEVHGRRDSGTTRGRGYSHASDGGGCNQESQGTSALSTDSDSYSTASVEDDVGGAVADGVRVEDVPAARFADYFVVVSCDEPMQGVDLAASTAPHDLELSPTVDSQLPRRPHREFPLPEDFPTFCFPLGAFLATDQHEPTYFTFTLMTADGTTVYVACATLLERIRRDEIIELVGPRLDCDALPPWLKDRDIDGAEPVYSPKCLCVVSHFPFFSAFRAILQQVVRISRSVSPLPVERYISYFIGAPLPPAGFTRIRLTLCDRIISIERPPENQLPLLDVPLKPLFQCLSIDNVIRAFTAMLTERSIVFCSNNVALLTPVTEALRALLFPFAWQTTYIPVLPVRLYEFICAPVPFVYGIHGDPSVALRESEDVVCVDLDRNDVIVPEWEPLPRLPERARSKLSSALKAAASGVHGSASRRGGRARGADAFPGLRAQHRLWDTEVDGSPIRDFVLDSGVTVEDTAAAAITSPTSAITAEEDSGFSPVGIRKAFLRFMVSILLNYNKHVQLPTGSPDSAGSSHWSHRRVEFDKKRFLREKPSARALMGQVLDTQLFDRFLQQLLPRGDTAVNDQLAPSDPSAGLPAAVRYFDEAILAKQNRSILVLASRAETPFLDDQSHNITSTYHAPPPTAAGLPEHREYAYERFPHLRSSLAGPRRSGRIFVKPLHRRDDVEPPEPRQRREQGRDSEADGDAASSEAVDAVGVGPGGDSGHRSFDLGEAGVADDAAGGAGGPVGRTGANAAGAGGTRSKRGSMKRKESVSAVLRDIWSSSVDNASGNASVASYSSRGQGGDEGRGLSARERHALQLAASILARAAQTGDASLVEAGLSSLGDGVSPSELGAALRRSSARGSLSSVAHLQSALDGDGAAAEHARHAARAGMTRESYLLCRRVVFEIVERAERCVAPGGSPGSMSAAARTSRRRERQALTTQAAWLREQRELLR